MLAVMHLSGSVSNFKTSLEHFACQAEILQKSYDV